MTFPEARELAIEQSARFGCVQHINAAVTFCTSTGTVLNTNFKVEDWYDGSTVVSFENGREI